MTTFAAPATTLVAACDNGSPVHGALPNGLFSFTVYGYLHAPCIRPILTGFTGQPSLQGQAGYLLGNGRRFYNPLLMRFHSQDSLSPFGGGGINSYGYCSGDSVNFADRSGNMPTKAMKLQAGHTLQQHISELARRILDSDLSSFDPPTYSQAVNPPAYSVLPPIGYSTTSAARFENLLSEQEIISAMNLIDKTPEYKRRIESGSEKSRARALSKLDTLAELKPRINLTRAAYWIDFVNPPPSYQNAVRSGQAPAPEQSDKRPTFTDP